MGIFSNFTNKITPRLLAEVRGVFREGASTGGFKGGLRAVFKRYGWKILVIFFLYYLIRDSILYIFIPWLIARHFIEN